MIPPALVLVAILALLAASAFHAAFGRTWRGWGVAVLAALAGIAAGEAVARGLGHTRFLVGTVHVVHGLAGAAVGLVVAAWRVGR